MNQRNARAIQEIKARLNIVDIVRRYVELRRNGSRWVAPCPFHQETKPSFSVNEEEGFFYCFGCQASGDLFDFYGRINGLDFRETLEHLAEEAGVSLERFPGRGGDGSRREERQGERNISRRRQLLRVHELAAAHFGANLAAEAGSECREYIVRRGLSDEIIRGFGLGWSRRQWNALTETLRRAGFSDDFGVEAALLGRSERGRVYDRFRGRLIFPIRSLSGNVIAFGGRIIADEEEAKYINSSDSPLYKKGDHLYGLQQARRAVAAGMPFMLTEGYMDVLTLHQYGYVSGVGVLGTAFTPEQVKRLSGFASRVELLFDGDRAGRKAALRACGMLLAKGLSCKAVIFPESEDIDSLLRSSGRDVFEKLRASAPEGLVFCARALQDMAPKDAVDWAGTFLAQVELPELAGRYASILAAELGFSERELRERMVAGRNARRSRFEESGGSAREKDPCRNEAGVLPAAHGNVRDREIMTFAVRYPHAVSRLRDLGAQHFLVSPRARELWRKLEDLPSQTRIPPEDIVQYLDPKEKIFWIRCRTGDAPPLTSEEREFAGISAMLQTMQMARHSASVSAALRHGTGDSDFETDLDFLRALQETLERTHGEQH